LIDLRKGGLVAVLADLPYRLVVPLPVRSSEVLDFSADQWRRLDEAGLLTHDLTPEEVGQAFTLRAQHPTLSANDCFCYVTALVHRGILLTGDASLRKVATSNGLCVHGVLWIVDELVKEGVCPGSLLTLALETWRADDTVFLPEEEISTRLKRLAHM